MTDLNSPEFRAWLAELDAAASRRGYLGGPLSQQTGEECWANSYAEGLTPDQAITEDESYA